MSDSSEIYAQGYAVGAYNINNDIQSWRHRDQVIDLPHGTVELHDIDGYPHKVAKWDDIKKAEREASEK